MWPAQIFVEVRFMYDKDIDIFFNLSTKAELNEHRNFSLACVSISTHDSFELFYQNFISSETAQKIQRVVNYIEMKSLLFSTLIGLCVVNGVVATNDRSKI